MSYRAGIPVAEFTCCECGHSILALGVREPPKPALCNTCVTVPGWFRVPELRAILDPGHDGRETFEKQDPAR